MGYKNRDVEVVGIDGDKCLVVACDSCGAIGSKKLDAVKVPPYVTGRLTVRVALMELLSVGARLKSLSAAISNEPDPTGEEILKGIKDELEYINELYVPIAISTEKNMPTSQTAIGITAIGICSREQLNICRLQKGDMVYCLGLPKVGNEVEAFDDIQIATTLHIKKLLNMNEVGEILPIGSKGILKEAEMMAESVGCRLELNDPIKIDIHKSAGPSTCIIFTSTTRLNIDDLDGTPVTLLGKLY